MRYQDCAGSLDTVRKILKVNHAGEFGAVNIYRAQILVSKFFRRRYVPMLQNFMADETRHLNIFWTEIQKRHGVRCKSYWLCGVGGWAMGAISALFGKAGMMACTWAVESVVVHHLKEQLIYLNQQRDCGVYDAVKFILEDEENHRDIGYAEGGGNIFYLPFRFMISAFTEIVIRLGMR